MTKHTQIAHWKTDLLNTTLPRWDDLPDIDIYMDQLVTLIDRYTEPLQLDAIKGKTITPSMVNNYVKHQLIPKPVKKKYGNQHLARLMVITILKQAFEIPSIKTGVEFQINLTNSKDAYNLFCQHMETTIHYFINEHNETITIEQIKHDFAPIQMACTTLIAKLMTEKELVDLLTNPTTLGDDTIDR